MYFHLSITRFYTTNIWISQRHFEKALQVWFLANFAISKRTWCFSHCYCSTMVQIHICGAFQFLWCGEAPKHGVCMGQGGGDSGAGGDQWPGSPKITWSFPRAQATTSTCQQINEATVLHTEILQAIAKNMILDTENRHTWNLGCSKTEKVHRSY